VTRAREPCRRAWREVPGHGLGQGHARVQSGAWPGHAAEGARLGRGTGAATGGRGPGHGTWGQARPPGRTAGEGATRKAAGEGLTAGRGLAGAGAATGRAAGEGPRWGRLTGEQGRARAGQGLAARAGPRAGGGARAGEGCDQGEGRASRGRRKGGENSPRGSKLRRSRLQTLGHHRGRERGGRGRGSLLHRRKSNETKGLGGGGARMGRAGGTRGARAGPGRAGPGYVTSRIKTHETHDQ
jgi:hypothetical protein